MCVHLCTWRFTMKVRRRQAAYIQWCQMRLDYFHSRWCDHLWAHEGYFRFRYIFDFHLFQNSIRRFHQGTISVFFVLFQIYLIFSCIFCYLFSCSLKSAIHLLLSMRRHLIVSCINTSTSAVLYVRCFCQVFGIIVCPVLTFFILEIFQWGQLHNVRNNSLPPQVSF